MRVRGRGGAKGGNQGLLVLIVHGVVELLRVVRHFPLEGRLWRRVSACRQGPVSPCRDPSSTSWLTEVGSLPAL